MCMRKKILLAWISDVLDFTLELQHQHDESACKCPVLKVYDSDVTRSSHVSIEHSMSDPGADTILSSTSTRDNVGFLQTSVLPRSGVFILNDVLSKRSQFGIPNFCVPQRCYCGMPSRLINHGK
jgi:hypothetical protein